MAASITPATTPAESLITSNLDIWTSAIKQKASTGRGSNKKQELYGIKKLRELILELAVRGLLVPQDPTDEPASVLLEKIAAEKEQLIKEGKIKKQKSLPEISEDEKPFGISDTWCWSRLGDIAEVLDSLRKPISKADRVEGPYPYYGTSGIVDYVDSYIFDEPLVLVGEDGAKWGSGENTAFAINGKTWVNNHVHVLRPNRAAIIDEYLIYTLVQRDLIQYITGITVPKLNQARLLSITIPVPAVSEQQRIVFKLNELMALCDQLEQQTESSLAAHQTLVETLLNSLLEAAKVYPGHAKSAGVDAKNDPFQMAWQQIWDNFDLLFTTEYSIDQLKQTILQLAVMGKLVPQDPNDEPASVLLEKIAAEKEQLIKDKKVKKQKPLPPIGDDEKPFELPNGWEWCRGENVADFIDPHPSHRTPPVVEGGIPYVGYTDIDHKKGIDFIGARKVSPDVFKEHQDRYQLKKGDFVFGKIGTLGKPFFLRKPFNYCLSANLILIQPKKDLISPEYLALYLNSPVLYRVLDSKKTNSTHGVFGIKKARLLTVPYPPLKEQKSIVSKFFELVALLDSLKESITESKNTQLHLAEAMSEQIL